MCNNTFFELSLVNFKKLFPDLYCKNPIRSLVDDLLSETDGDKYRIRFNGSKLEIGFADDEWSIQ